MNEAPTTVSSPSSNSRFINHHIRFVGFERGLRAPYVVTISAGEKA
jgi:hypothetical protein